MASNQGQRAEEAAEATLRLLDPTLVRLIRRNSGHEANLRRLAWSCARYALRTCQLHDEVLEHALAHMQAGVPLCNSIGWKQYRQQISQVVDRLDAAAFQAQASKDEADGVSDEYLSAFRAARAASSVLACLNESALLAAVESCYESTHATGRADALIHVAEEALSY